MPACVLHAHGAPPHARRIRPLLPACLFPPVQVWDMRTWRPQALHRIPRALLLTVTLCGGKLWSGSSPSTLRVWQPRTSLLPDRAVQSAPQQTAAARGNALAASLAAAAAPVVGTAAAAGEPEATKDAKSGGAPSRATVQPPQQCLGGAAAVADTTPQRERSNSDERRLAEALNASMRGSSDSGSGREDDGESDSPNHD